MREKKKIDRLFLGILDPHKSLSTFYVGIIFSFPPFCSMVIWPPNIVDGSVTNAKTCEEVGGYSIDAEATYIVGATRTQEYLRIG